MVTIEEVALRLRVEPRNVEALVASGALRGQRIGEAWRVSERELERYVDGAPRRSRWLPVASAALVALAVSGLSWWAHAAISPTAPLAPEPIPYRGYLERGGVPVDGAVDLTFQLFESATSSAPLWQERRNAVSVAAGQFHVELGTSTPIGDRVLAEPTLYVGVVVHEAGGDVPLTGRQRLASVPYSRRAGNGVPPGTIAPFGGSEIPDGWLLCDGRALDRDDERFAALYAAIGTSWGDGSTGGGSTLGVTDFNLPDLRGRFLRGVDLGAGQDPEAAMRTAAAVGGSMGDAVGTLQPSATSLPRRAWTVSTYSHSHTFPDAHTSDGDSSNCIDSGPCQSGSTRSSTDTHTHTVDGGDAETRPVNASVSYMIRL